MAKPGAGKRKMAAQRKKQWNSTVKSLKSTGRALRGGRRKKGCYVATCVYGSYDCPPVWVLRRYRDDTLEKSWLGRIFISTYYMISPALVKTMGHNEMINNHWRKLLDRFVAKLKQNGVKDTPYID